MLASCPPSTGREWAFHSCAIALWFFYRLGDLGKQMFAAVAAVAAATVAVGPDCAAPAELLEA